MLRLSLVGRRFSEILSSDNAQQLHARLFVDRFDTKALIRRFGARATQPTHLADEYRRRMRLLGFVRSQSRMELDSCLWLAYLMLLEDGALKVAPI